MGTHSRDRTPPRREPEPHDDDASPVSGTSDLRSLGRILRLLSEVTSHLEGAGLGVTTEVEELIREGLKTSSLLLDQCLQQSSARCHSDQLARKMMSLLGASQAESSGDAPPPSDPDGVVMREVEEDGKLHLEIETVGDADDGTLLQFSSAEVDAALELFDEVAREGDPAGDSQPATLDLSDHETEQLQQLFHDIASQYVAPLSRILGELFQGRATRQTVEGAVGIFRNLLRSADALRMTETADAASSLVDLFSAAEMTGAPPTGVELKAIRGYYENLRKMHPEMFPDPAWEPEKTDKARQRIDLETITVLEEFKSIPGLGKRRIERLFECGLSSLEALRRAEPLDFQSVARMSPALAQRIASSFRKYRPRTGESSALTPRDRRRLSLYLRILTQSQYLYRKAALDEDYRGRSSSSRRPRETIRKRTSSRILAYLAHLRLSEAVCLFQRASYDRRIKLLRSLLTSS